MRCAVKTQVSAAREDLGSVLSDLPRGSHIMAHVGLPEEELLQACHDSAMDAGERWLVHEPLPSEMPPGLARDVVRFPHFTAETFGPLLTEALRDAHRHGIPGLLLTILPERRMRVLGPASHMASETALGPRVHDQVRVVCLYTARADEMAESVANDLATCHTRVFTIVHDEGD